MIRQPTQTQSQRQTPQVQMQPKATPVADKNTPPALKSDYVVGGTNEDHLIKTITTTGMSDHITTTLAKIMYDANCSGYRLSHTIPVNNGGEQILIFDKKRNSIN